MEDTFVMPAFLMNRCYLVHNPHFSSFSSPSLCNMAYSRNVYSAEDHTVSALTLCLCFYELIRFYLNSVVENKTLVAIWLILA